LQALANLAAIAFENARLYGESRAEVLAERQLSTLGRAMAAIEHRINNTLNIIVPNLNRLRKRVDQNDPKIQEILDIIERNTRYTSSLLERIRTPLLEVNYVEVNINALLTEIYNRQRLEWVSDKTRWLVESHLVTDPNIPYVRLPIGQISEVIQNLIQNAYREMARAYEKKKANPPLEVKEDSERVISGACLYISSAVEADKIKIRVRDTVPGGIPSKIEQRLFTRPVPSQIPGEGSGLGLWLSKMIMDSIGGDIRIESTGLYGTTMLVEIPLQMQRNEEQK
jgi:two-component system NtrC family sensor kinase